MITFVIGFILGGWCGMALMCLMFAAKKADSMSVIPRLDRGIQEGMDYPVKPDNDY